MPPQSDPPTKPGAKSAAEIEALTRDLLGRVPDLRQRFHELVSTQVIDASSAAGLDQRDALGHYVWECALQALGSADDVIETWRQIYVADIRPATGHVVLLRSVLDSATFTRWLVDLDVTSQERVRRGVLAHLADGGERARFAAVVNRAITLTPPGNWGEDRLADLLAECRLRELRVVDRRGKPLPPGSPTERCRRYAHAPAFGGEAAYRVLSAFAHGYPWTLPFLTRELHPEMRTPTSAIITIVSYDPGLMAIATDWAVKTLVEALNDAVRYIQPGASLAAS